jgi:ketosteroid isomerase-like protein
MAAPERKARLEELAAAGWTTELFAEFWAAPDLELIPFLITEDVVGHWPGGRTVRGKAQYMQALEELLALLPDLRLEVPDHTMSADGELGFSRWVMHATGANGPFKLDGMDRTRIRDGLVCENYIFFDSAQFRALVGTDTALEDK